VNQGVESYQHLVPGVPGSAGIGAIISNLSPLGLRRVWVWWFQLITTALWPSLESNLSMRDTSYLHSAKMHSQRIPPPIRRILNCEPGCRILPASHPRGPWLPRYWGNCIQPLAFSITYGLGVVVSIDNHCSMAILREQFINEGY
jgi:hypothetical protein